MEKICFTLQVRPDRIAEYRRHHSAVWPQMQTELTRANWNNYSLFLRPDGLVVGYVESPNFEASLAQMAGTDVNERWQAVMRPLVASAPRQRVDQGLEVLSPIFHLP